MRLAKRWPLAVLIIGLAWWALKRPLSWRPPPDEGDLRDAPSSAWPLTPGHAALGAGSRNSCQQCHSPSSSAHAGSNSMHPSWKADVSSVPGSAVCLACHDGSLAHPGATQLDGGHDNHPIGSEYSEFLTLHPDRFRDISDRKDVRLEAGRIGCLSCHTIHRSEAFGRRPTINESSCEACHNL